MSYQLIWFYEKPGDSSSNRVAVLNKTGYSLLPFVYESLAQFMLFTLLNNDQIIFDKNDYLNAYSYFDQKYNFDDECLEVVELIKTYDCKEITIQQIKENIPAELKGITERYGF